MDLHARERIAIVNPEGYSAVCASRAGAQAASSVPRTETLQSLVQFRLRFWPLEQQAAPPFRICFDRERSAGSLEAEIVWSLVLRFCSRGYESISGLRSRCLWRLSASARG